MQIFIEKIQLKAIYINMLPSSAFFVFQAFFI